jgi:CheY-like chemotaxis protein
MTGEQKRAVLVVDDHVVVRSVLSILLVEMGLTVRLAVDGPQGLTVHRQYQGTIGLVLLDVRLPGMDGPQTLAALRQINPDVCCCFMSGSLSQQTTEKLQTLGATGVLAKPFDLEAPAEKVRQLMNP